MTIAGQEHKVPYYELPHAGIGAGGGDEDPPGNQRDVPVVDFVSAYPQPGIKEASRPLKDALDEPPPLFTTAHGKNGVGKLSPDYEAIVETIYLLDAGKMHRRLQDEMVIGEERASYAVVLKALDTAEANARDAHRLYLGALIEQKSWELDQEKVRSSMRTSATERLEEEKERGLRKKQITEADVTSTIAEMYPDEWRHQELRKAKIKGMVEQLQAEASIWQQRCRTLNTILSTLRK